VPPLLSLLAATRSAASCASASSDRSLRVLPREAYLNSLLASRAAAGLLLRRRLCFFLLLLRSLLRPVSRPINQQQQVVVQGCWAVMGGWNGCGRGWSRA
jgi:hypothetical protein